MEGGIVEGREISGESGLSVAVTGPTGTFGSGLLPLLQADPRIGRVTGVARRPFDPAARGWTKMHYSQGDVRNPAALDTAFHGADVVVHLAFLITGAEPPGEVEQTNVGGTLNAYRAAAAVGARRFVYASSVAAYGFHGGNPAELTEDWPVRPAARLFYARQKAELEQLLVAEAAGSGRPSLYMIRPCVVVGPHAVGAKDLLPGPLAPLGRRLAGAVLGFRPPVPVPVAAPAIPLQLVHEQDVGRALLLCAVGAGPPGAYNIAADGLVTPADILRELGFLPVPMPAAPVHAAARLLTALPVLPGVAGWAEAVSRPVIMDTTRARELLGWSPRFTALQALRDTVRRRPGP